MNACEFTIVNEDQSEDRVSIYAPDIASAWDKFQAQTGIVLES